MKYTYHSMQLQEEIYFMKAIKIAEAQIYHKKVKKLRTNINIRKYFFPR